MDKLARGRPLQWGPNMELRLLAQTQVSTKEEIPFLRLFFKLNLNLYTK